MHLSAKIQCNQSEFDFVDGIFVHVDIHISKIALVHSSFAKNRNILLYPLNLQFLAESTFSHVISLSACVCV